MSTVQFKRGNTTEMDNTPITDGMLYFNTTDSKIYMDNGNTRLQYGGDTSLISNPAQASNSNAFSATGSIGLFLQKTTVVDDKAAALAVTQNYIPLGCLAFKSAVGTTDISTIGDGTISGAILSSYNNGTTALNYLNNTGIPALTRHDNQLTAPTGAQMYMDYQNGKYGVNTSAARGADTFIPFKPNPTTDNVTVLFNEGHYRKGQNDEGGWLPAYGTSGSVTVPKNGVVYIGGGAGDDGCWVAEGGVSVNGTRVWSGGGGGHSRTTCNYWCQVTAGSIISFDFHANTGVCTGGYCTIVLFSAD
jgi:hypothetical protein